MIITFKLEGLDRTSGDCLIVDNCIDLRITTLNNSEKKNKANDNFGKLSLMDSFCCKRWEACKGTLQKEGYLVEFISNNKNYYVLTKGTVYIANDVNKTIRMLNA